MKIKARYILMSFMMKKNIKEETKNYLYTLLTGIGIIVVMFMVFAIANIFFMFSNKKDQLPKGKFGDSIIIGGIILLFISVILMLVGGIGFIMSDEPPTPTDEDFKGCEKLT
jgi:ABC-type polysaccharide/polyol phosphate export permease